MRVLVACEESQAVCKAFRARGHEAYSCDIIPCSGGHPEWHIQGDVLDVLEWKDHGNNCGGIWFTTGDGTFHDVQHWDLIIAHPPCTFLTAAGAVRLFKRDHTIKDLERYRKGQDAAAFFWRIWLADCLKIVIENPIPMKCFGLPKYSQIIEPFMFGDPWRKRTCLWEKGVNPLVADNPVEPEGLWVGATSYCGHPDRPRYKLQSSRDPKIRSKTFPGIARAMAEQWG